MLARAAVGLLPLLLLLFASLRCALHVGAQQPPQTLADVQITAVSGCVDQPPVTVNCSVGSSTLLIQTATGFPSTTLDHLLQQSYWVAVTAQLNDYTYFQLSRPWLNPTDSTNSSVYVNVTAGGYYPHITGQLISVTLNDYYTGTSSPSFGGFSYAFDGPPTLTAISGCEGAGQSTLSCVPDAAVLTLLGSGFLWYSSGRGTTLTIGNETSEPLSSQLQVLNDSCATLSLVAVYGSLLQPQHYAGVLLPMSITSTAASRSGQLEYSYTTNALQISFVPLPSPLISQWYILQCQGEPNATQYTNCFPTASALYLYGAYMYDAQVTVGGVPCVATFTAASIAVCSLPDFDFDPTVFYDVVVSNDAGRVTLSGLVQYSDAPTLLSVDSCIDRGEAWVQQPNSPGALCPVGTTITIRGSRFPTAPDAVDVQFNMPYARPRLTISLLAPAVLNSTAMTATLPPLNLSAFALNALDFATVRVNFTVGANSTLTPPLYNNLLLPLLSPNITSVTSASCDSLSPLQLANCRAMAAITVAGSNLAVGRTSFVPSLAGSFLDSNSLLPSNSSLVAVSNTSLIFQLAYFDADTNTQLQPDVVYTLLAVSAVGLYQEKQYSNAFRLSLTYATASTNPPGSHSEISSGAVAGIVIAVVVVALLLVAAVVWLVRRQKTSGQASGELQWSMSGGRGQRGSEDYKDLELH